MYIVKVASLLAFLSPLCSAVPVANTDSSELEARNSAVTYNYSDENCANVVAPLNKYPGCFTVGAAVRSIRSNGSGCTITIWTGIDCKGNSFNVPQNACYKALYGSYTVRC